MKNWIVIAVLFFCSCCSNLPKKQCSSQYLDFATIKKCVKYCKQSYDETNFGIVAQNVPNRVIVDSIKELDVRYFVVFNDSLKTQDIVIRGTTSLENMKINGNCEEVIDKKLNLLVHKGFSITADAVYNKIIGSLKKNYKTLITGHSLGGSVAVLLHCYLYEDKFDVLPFYTFGQPKLFTKEGVLKFRCIRLMRIVNKTDAVCFLPPTTCLTKCTNYLHLGDEIIFISDSTYIYFEDHVAKTMDTRDFWKDIQDGRFKVHDHDINLYLKRVSNPNVESAGEAAFN